MIINIHIIERRSQKKSFVLYPGFGDFVPGDAVLNVNAENGQAKLLLAVVYVLMGLAVVAMTINLVQEEIIERFRQLAIDIGIIDDDENDDNIMDEEL